ncbi:somatostatin receptor type 2-like [Rhopilema esculentum]|uniref:somatostatin receptor type 2-like n=1 Tax=Rhopilema esculentum TaxID=499914 RepID=UPI0031DA8E64|eukprot:gene4526-20778_t
MGLIRQCKVLICLAIVLHRVTTSRDDGNKTAGPSSLFYNRSGIHTSAFDRYLSSNNISIDDKSTSNSTCNGTLEPNSSKNNSKKPGFTGQKEDVHLLATQVTLYAIVFIVGVTGNTLVLLTVTSKRMRSVRNLLIGNLATADLITLLVCLPITVAGLFMSWPFGPFICSYLFPLTDVLVSVSIVTLCVITMDRFRAIVHPFAQKMTLKVTIIVIALIWLFSYLVVALPLVQFMKIRPSKGGRLVCVASWPKQVYGKIYRAVILTFLYIIPVILVFLSFVRIVKKIRENMRFTRLTVRDSRSLAKVQRRSRVVWMMFVIFITFTLCLLPIHLLLTLTVFYPPTRSWPPIGGLYHASLIILVANSAMNPIILYLLSSDFKRGFKENCLCYAIFLRVRSPKHKTNANFHKSLDQQQVTTCLNIPHGHHETEGSSIELKELIKTNGKIKQNGVETAF